jgi:hypothetical protein
VKRIREWWSREGGLVMLLSSRKVRQERKEVQAQGNDFYVPTLWEWVTNGFK